MISEEQALPRKLDHSKKEGDFQVFLIFIRFWSYTPCPTCTWFAPRVKRATTIKQREGEGEQQEMRDWISINK